MKTSQGGYPLYHYSHMSTLNLRVFVILVAKLDIEHGNLGVSGLHTSAIRISRKFLRMNLKELKQLNVKKQSHSNGIVPHSNERNGRTKGHSNEDFNTKKGHLDIKTRHLDISILSRYMTKTSRYHTQGKPDTSKYDTMYPDITHKMK